MSQHKIETGLFTRRTIGVQSINHEQFKTVRPAGFIRRMPLKPILTKRVDLEEKKNCLGVEKLGWKRRRRGGVGGADEGMEGPIRGVPDTKRPGHG